MAPQAPAAAAAATGVRDMRPRTCGAVACGEVGPGAGVRSELGGKRGEYERGRRGKCAGASRGSP